MYAVQIRVLQTNGQTTLLSHITALCVASRIKITINSDDYDDDVWWFADEEHNEAQSRYTNVRLSRITKSSEAR